MEGMSESATVIHSDPRARAVVDGRGRSRNVEVAVLLCAPAFEPERFERLHRLVLELHGRGYEVEGGGDGYVYCQRRMSASRAEEEALWLKEQLNRCSGI